MIEKLHCEFIVENRLRFLEGNAMFPEIEYGLGRIPLEIYRPYFVWESDCRSSPPACIANGYFRYGEHLSNRRINRRSQMPRGAGDR